MEDSGFLLQIIVLPLSLLYLLLWSQRKIWFGGLRGVLGLQTRLNLVRREVGSIPAATLGRCLCVRLLGNPKLWERDKAMGPAGCFVLPASGSETEPPEGQ